MTFKWKIYEYVNERGKSVIGEWLVEKAISGRDRGQLLQKMDMLATLGPDLPPRLLAGPVASKKRKKLQSHTYKLIIHGDKMLRPFLCKGPIDMDKEFTMLLGAIEVNFELDEDVEDAEIRRTEIINNPQKRRINGRYE
jgi:hypothetical protein